MIFQLLAQLHCKQSRGKIKMIKKKIKIKPNKFKLFYNLNYAPFDDSAHLRQMRIPRNYKDREK